jgi:arylsulfatase A-like enzyme
MDKGPFLYDPVCRIPLVVRLPDGRGAGTRDNHIVYNMDLMPTFLELAGTDVPDALDAASLLPLWAGRAHEFPDRHAAFSEYHGHQVPAFGRMVRTNEFKYIFNACGLDELYDLRADPFERRNLIDDPTAHDQLTELRGMLADYLREQDDPVLRFYLGTRFD